MMRQSLQRRLERLEEAVLPVEDEPETIEVYYCDTDGTKTLGQVIELPPCRLWASRINGRRGRRFR
jgi:hypothetical protein